MECGGIEYGKTVPVVPLTVTLRAVAAAVDDPWPKNSTVPVRVLIVLLVRMICVLHPPPSAKIGSRGSAPGVEVDIGAVENTKSLRSFVSPRVAITATGTVDVKL